MTSAAGRRATEQIAMRFALTQRDHQYLWSAVAETTGQVRRERCIQLMSFGRLLERALIGVTPLAGELPASVAADLRAAFGGGPTSVRAKSRRRAPKEIVLRFMLTREEHAYLWDEFAEKTGQMRRERCVQLMSFGRLLEQALMGVVPAAAVLTTHVLSTLRVAIGEPPVSDVGTDTPKEGGIDYLDQMFDVLPVGGPVGAPPTTAQPSA
jgi:hypothetical protein